MRFISNSQAGAGSLFIIRPDHTAKHTVVDTDSYLTMLQRKLGLYCSVVYASYVAQARLGRPVGQHEYLGDAAVNNLSKTVRHNEGLWALHRAMKCASKLNASIRLGDQGGGTAAGKARATAEHAHLNAGYIPDMYRVGSPHELWEFKCYSPYKPKPALGNGSARCGGAPSTADGNLFAHGNTLEYLRTKVYGLDVRGSPDQPALNRETGVGRVDAKPGDYSDALGKGSLVHLMSIESTGAMSPDLVKTLKALDKLARSPDGHDATPYGTARHSTHSFFQYHSSALSLAVQLADARSIRNMVASLAFLASNAPVTSVTSS